ncbi:MAG: C39 family peptidase, partial [Acutalibacteraceae bacterium]
MSKRYKPLSKKWRIIIYISCALAAIVAAVGTTCVIMHFCQTKLPAYSYFSSTPLSVSYIDNDDTNDEDEYDIVEVIEPEAQELPTNINVETVTEFKEKVDEIKQTEQNTIVVQNSLIDASGLANRQFKLPVKYLSQNPELPTGCEITSLTTVLNYLGYNVSKLDMSDNYLEKSIDQIADFWEVFLGDPKSNGFGCYAQPIVNAANKYLKTQDQKYTAVNYSGTRFEKLLKQVENGNPVIIWSTIYREEEKDLREPFTTYKWEVNGKTVQWIAPEHCMVLIGYDIDRNIAVMSDPQRGIVEYNLETVKARYIALHSQCVILEKTDFHPVINGVQNNATYYTTQYVTVADDNLSSVTVNGEKSDTAFFIDGNTNKTYKIEAVDKSGNITTVTVHTKNIASIAEPITDLDELNITEDNRDAVNAVRNIALSVNTYYA